METNKIGQGNMDRLSYELVVYNSVPNRLVGSICAIGPPFCLDCMQSVFLFFCEVRIVKVTLVCSKFMNQVSTNLNITFERPSVTTWINAVAKLE